MTANSSELNSYILGKTLGKGTFGKVKLAKHKATGQLVAIKILEKAKIKDVTDVERVSRQLHILKITLHSSIAQMYEIIETALNIFIVMEYAPLGQFFDYIMDGRIKSQAEAHHYFVQIVAGLEYLHELKISHRDVKPENMLLDNDNRLKIVDFGLSNMYRQGEFLLTACGSPCYASPEMIKGEQYDPELTDVWSLGVVLFSMAFAKLPFEDDNTSVLYGKIKSGLYVIDKKISFQLKDLLSRLLCVKPKNRINLKQIKQHPWYRREHICKCNGINVGYENAPLDEEILACMQNLGYDVVLARKYLENNIRNEVTTAYYLLMKKKFKEGEPSPYDICNENFSRKVIMPKVSRVNTRAKQRHHSLDFHSPTNFETLQAGPCMLPVKSQIKNALARPNKIVTKERNCYSQMKSEEYDDNRQRMTVYRSNQPAVFKNFINSRHGNRSKTKQVRENLSRSKKSDTSDKNFSEKRKTMYKNLQKEQNISINVYINNSKISTPTRKKSKMNNSKLDKRMLQFRQQNNYVNNFKISQKRLKTQAIDRMRSEKKSSNRYEREYDSIKFDSESKSLQKSSNTTQPIECIFWKKRSTNVRGRQNTTDSKKDSHLRARQW